MNESLSLSSYVERELARRIRQEELAVAMGVALATLKRRKASGFSADEVITVARHFHLPPVGALVALGYVTQDDVDAAATAHPMTLSDADDVDLARELLRRVSEPGEHDALTYPLDAHDPIAARAIYVSDRARTIGANRDDYGPAASEGGDPDAVSQANEGQA